MKRLYKSAAVLCALLVAASAGFAVSNSPLESIPYGITANAATVSNVAYLDKNGNPLTCASATTIDSQNDNLTINTNGWYVVQGTVTINGKINIDTNRTVNIILADNSYLDIQGIDVPASSTLNIYSQSFHGQSTGTVNIVRNTGPNSGINGDKPNAASGTINIYGGAFTITVKHHKAYGIGANQSSSQNININNADIAVTGGAGAYISDKTTVYNSNITHGGTVVNGNTPVIPDKPCSVVFTVTIPADTVINSTFQVKAENVTLPANRTLKVSMSSDDIDTDDNFIMTSAEGAQLKYKVTSTNGVTNYANNASVIQVTGAVTSVTRTVDLKTVLDDEVIYSGDYTGHLTFTVSLTQ